MNCSSCGHKLKPAGQSWSFAIPVEPPSQNVISSNRGAGRWKYKAIRDEFEQWLDAKARKVGISKATGRRRVHILRQYGSRGKVRDRGNLIGGCKPLLDAMISAGMIVDDAPQWIEDHYEQERASQGGVVITVEELDG